MPPAIAAIVFAIVILGLFILDRDPDVRTSPGLWIPICWLFINSSRAVSTWLGVSSPVSAVDEYVDGSPFDRAVFLTLLIAGLIVLFRRGPQASKLLRVNAPIILFFLFCFASIFWSDYSFIAFKRWTKAIGDIVMVLIVFTDLDPEAALKRLILRVGYVLVPLSVLFIKYYPELGRSLNQWSWNYMYSGVSTTKNGLGTTCLVCGLVPLWRFFTVYRDKEQKRRGGKMLAYAVMVVMVLWLFVTADSMTSLSCFLMAGMLIMVTNMRAFEGKPWVAHFLLAVMLSLSLFALFFDTGGNLVGSLGRDATMTGRTGIWKAVLSVSGSPLVGTGFESFWMGERLQRVWDLTAKGIQEAHNGYLEVYLNLGWMGIGLLGVVIVSGYRNAIAVYRRNVDAGRIRLAFFAVALVYNFTEAGFRMMDPVWIAFLLAAFAIPVAPVQQEQAAPLDLELTERLTRAKPRVNSLIPTPVRREIV
jgi:exopolysaccharide production protein ExoQ